MNMTLIDQVTAGLLSLARTRGAVLACGAAALLATGCGGGGDGTGMAASETPSTTTLKASLEPAAPGVTTAQGADLCD
jgi:hypothetical protein